VHALIVGIEAYGAGPLWDLPGPARDAVRFRRMLRTAGVPEANLHVHLSPLPPYAPEVPYAPADHATLRRALVRHLPQAPGDVLWVWRGGHGVLDLAGHLRLFCADATTADKLGIDLDSALARYAGDAVPGFAEQLWIVDACETFEEDLAFREQLPPDALPVGRRTLGHRQTVLRAAGRGRAAANDPRRATGLFSDVLLALLAERSGVLPAPPDAEELFPAVRARIAALRESGRTLQHPEIRLRSPERTESLGPPTPAPVTRPASPLARAVEALLAYPLMGDPGRGRNPERARPTPSRGVVDPVRRRRVRRRRRRSQGGTGPGLRRVGGVGEARRRPAVIEWRDRTVFDSAVNGHDGRNTSTRHRVPSCEKGEHLGPAARSAPRRSRRP
jgi:hypothetical protein